MGRMIAVTSGKGGTGKSTVATGLALAFAKMNLTVLLVDLDAGLRCLDLMLGIDTQVVLDLSDVLKGRPFPDALYPADEQGLIHLIPAPAQYEDPDTEALKTLLQTVRDQFDIILLDFPAGVDFKAYESLPASTQMITVCNPDPVSVRDAAVVCERLPKFRKTPLFILNKFSAEMIRSGIYENIDSIIDASGFRLLGIVPVDHDLLLLPVRHGLSKKSRGFKALTRIAYRLDEHSVPLPKPKKI